MIRSLLAALLLAAPALADPARDATGRLAKTALETGPNCTAILVAPARALSAGHCVGPFVNPHMKFFTGWELDGGYDTALPVAGFRRVERTPLLPPSVRDIVVIDLAPRVTAARPLPFGPAPEVGERVRVISYPRHAGAQPRDTACTVTDLTDAVLRLDCPASSGMSGAPVLVETPEGWALAAILVARKGRDASLALLVDPGVAGN